MTTMERERRAGAVTALLSYLHPLFKAGGIFLTVVFAGIAVLLLISVMSR